MHAIRKLLRGSASLPFAYWIIGVVGNSIIRLVDSFIWESGYYMILTPENARFESAFLVVDLSYGVFSMICVWNSAGNYEGPKVWAGLARFWVVTGSLFIALDIAVLVGLIDQYSFL